MTAKVARRALVRCYRYFVALHPEFQTLESGFEQKTGVENRGRKTQSGMTSVTMWLPFA